MLLEQDGFLNQLTKMYDRARLKGSVYVTSKRVDKDGKWLPRKAKAEAAAAELQAGEVPETKVLVRASCGKAKFSTLVPAKDHARFATSLMNIAKVKMDALKRKERVKVAKKKSSKA